MSQSKRSKFITKQKVLIIVGVIGSVVAVGGIGALTSLLQHSVAPPSSDVTNQTGLPEDNRPEAAKEAQDLALNGKTDEADKKLRAALASPSISDEDKYLMTLQLGTNQSRQGHYDAALTYFYQVEAIKPNYNISSQIGRTLLKKGDTAKALVYFKKALSQLDPQYPTYEAEKARLEEQISQLGG